MKIQVTQRDISLANKRRHKDPFCLHPHKNCPVALAMKRITHKPWSVGITLAALDERTVILPDNVSDRIYNWEIGKRMYPFTFEI